jgi:hypothetical protein
MITQKVTLFLLCFLIGNNPLQSQLSETNRSTIPQDIDSLELALKAQAERVAREGRHSIMYVAQCLAQGTTTDGFFDYEFLHQIIEALEKIRAEYPEVKNINPEGGVYNTLSPVVANDSPLRYRYPRGNFSIRDIFVYLTNGATNRILESYPKRKEWKLSSVQIDSTGIKNIDSLNTKLGATEIKIYLLSKYDGSSLYVKYANYHDILQLIKEYEHYKEVKYAQVNEYIQVGPPNQIYLLRKNNAWYFAFCRSRGEGRSREYYIFNYSPISKTVKKMLEFLPPCKDFESDIWLGLIDRQRSLKPFQSFNQILKTVRSKKWWHKLYALDVLGQLLLPQSFQYAESNKQKVDIIRKEVGVNQKKVIKILLDNLNNVDSDISMTAYLYLRLFSKKDYNKTDIKKWKTWYNFYQKRTNDK